MTDEEYLDFCHAGSEHAERSTYSWPDCAEFPVVAYELSAADKELAHQYNKFMDSFPGTNFGGGTMTGINGLFGGIGIVADNPSPSYYFESFGKRAIARNFKMMSNVGDRYVRKPGEVASQLKSNPNWYMLRRDYDQYGVLRMIPYIVESKDPMDPMLCSLFLVMSTENVEIDGTWENWVKYHSRVGHGYPDATLSIGGVSLDHPSAGTLINSVSNSYANVWSLYNAGLKDVLICIGDAIDKTPLQQCSRNDVMIAGIGLEGGSATPGTTVIGGMIPQRPYGEIMIPEETRYPLNSFPVVGQPISTSASGKRSIYIGPRKEFYNWFTYVNILLSDWGYVDGGEPGTDAALMAIIWPELLSSIPASGTGFARQNINLWIDLARVWTPSLMPSKGRRILETQLDLPYEGFKRVLDMQASHDPLGLMTAQLRTPEVTPTRIDNAIRLVLKITESAVQKGVDAMEGAKYSDPSVQKKGRSFGVSRGQSSRSFGSKGSGGGRKKKWLPKKEYEAKKAAERSAGKTTDSFDDKMKSTMGSAAPVLDRKPEFQAEDLDQKGSSEK
jgi:hypothetical protein